MKLTRADVRMRQINGAAERAQCLPKRRWRVA